MKSDEIRDTVTEQSIGSGYREMSQLMVVATTVSHRRPDSTVLPANTEICKGRKVREHLFYSLNQNTKYMLNTMYLFLQKYNLTNFNNFCCFLTNIPFNQVKNQLLYKSWHCPPCYYAYGFIAFFKELEQGYHLIAS